ncbi:hypothetical protein A3H85_02910 [Candidatus Daviesbacteria bacterium RIFCSPLOWO2_02_FULL_40_8]|uniref:Uncharacterized protein n=1 Tax=Candidatus Daviesbacteria bacterium RIFCSPLOWO2_01_FULL_40_24 TaxID=1797787 RepID=A0A1F5MKG6_9BACT|nr:MAG: hypothetical protein A3B49_03275 [Candidatus Daviesbacteria bacterium RIFCSPLOWO2_01_FULL_40_24]OGE67002.1 MAG: hypothetical protein A3H85_02910 [Candidatus Daviesbacteria bacterium RIFCSPLOWO2_02_FULL_40_8]
MSPDQEPAFPSIESNLIDLSIPPRRDFISGLRNKFSLRIMAVATLAAAVGYASLGEVKASTVESTLSTGIIMVGTSLSPVQEAEVGNASTIGSVIAQLNSEIASRRVTNPSYLSRNTNNGAIVITESDRSLYQTTHGVALETDIETVEQSIRNDLAVSGVIPAGTNAASESVGFNVDFIINTQNASASLQVAKWDQPDAFITSGVQAVDGFTVIANATTRITNIKDQLIRDALRVPLAHYANIIPSNFATGGQMDNEIYPSLKTVQVHTDAKVSGNLINNGLVETGTGGISLNHASLLKFRQYQNTTHNLSEIVYNSYHLPAHFKNTRFRIHPVNGTVADYTINQSNQTTNADVSFTTSEFFIATATTGKSGKTLNNLSSRAITTANQPLGSEIFDVLANGSIDPRSSVAYIVFDRGLATERQAVVTANQLEYIFTTSVDQTSNTQASDITLYVRSFTSTDTVDSAKYLDMKYLINSNTTASTPLPTITSTATITQTATGTPTSTPTFTVTSTSTETPTVTQTATVTPTSTETQTSTATVTFTPTSTETPTTTSTVTFTATETATGTPTPTVTNTETQTTTATPSLTPTIQSPSGGFPFPPANPTSTETNTATPTATETATGTPTPTITNTETVTPTATIQSSGGGLPFPQSSSTPTETGTPTETPTEIPVSENKRYFPVIIQQTERIIGLESRVSSLIANIKKLLAV